MHILRNVLLGAAAIALSSVLSGSLVAGGQSTATPAEPGKMPMTGRGMPMNKPMMTREQKIANAISAAPASITAKATILDWPAKDGDAPAVVRAGSNGWN